MTNWFILVMAVALTVIAIWKVHFIWGIVAFISWWLLFLYTRTSPLTGIVVGDASDTAFTLIIWGASIGILLYTTLVTRSRRQKEEREVEKENKERGIRTTSAAKEPTSDYYDRLHRLTHPRR